MGGKPKPQPKRKRGRQPEITRAKVNLIVKAVGHGTPRKQAARLAKINYTTYRNWMNRGERAWDACKEDVTKVPVADRLYVDLFLRVGAAIAKTVDDALKNIGDAGKKNWQASAWLVSRLCPDRFADNRQEFSAMKKQMRQLLKEIDDYRAARPAAPAEGDKGAEGVVTPAPDPVPTPEGPTP